MELDTALITFGIAPAITFGIYLIYSLIRSMSSIEPNGEVTPAAQINEARRVALGESSIMPAVANTPRKLENQPNERKVPNPSGVPLFETLRADVYPISKARWKVKIKFLLYNTTDQEIVLDDMHVRVYEKFVPTPPLLTISYRGEMELMQDNSIWKEEQAYSLAPGDGFEMVLAMEIVRLEGAPLYGPDGETPGAMLTVFGLLLDYYAVLGQTGIHRSTIPSNGLFLFENMSREGPYKIYVVTEQTVNQLMAPRYKTSEANTLLARLDHHLTEHRANRSESEFTAA